MKKLLLTALILSNGLSARTNLEIECPDASDINIEKTEDSIMFVGTYNIFPTDSEYFTQNLIGKSSQIQNKNPISLNKLESIEITENTLNCNYSYQIDGPSQNYPYISLTAPLEKKTVQAINDGKITIKVTHLKFNVTINSIE